MARYTLSERGEVVDTVIQKRLREADDNPYWVEYLNWVAQGNTADPYVPPVKTKDEELAETQPEFISSLDWVVQYLIDTNVIKAADIPPELAVLYAVRKAIKDK